MKKMTLLGFGRHEQLQVYGNIFMIGIGVRSSTFVMVPFLLTLLQKKCLLTPQTLPFCNGENSSVVEFHSPAEWLRERRCYSDAS